MTNQISLLNQMRLMATEARSSSEIAPKEDTKFGDIFKETMQEVNNLQLSADKMRAGYELGEPVSISEVMVAGQKASLALEATKQVRNQVVRAYQDIMSMPL